MNAPAPHRVTSEIVSEVTAVLRRVAGLDEDTARVAARALAAEGLLSRRGLSAATDGVNRSEGGLAAHGR